MATFRKLPSGKHNVPVRRKGRPPLSETFATKTEAKAWATKIESDIDHRRQFGHSRIRTLADGIDAFKASDATIKTLKDRNRHLDWWQRKLGQRKLIECTADILELGRARLASENIETDPEQPPRRRAPRTVRHYLMSLSACMDYLKRK